MNYLKYYLKNITVSLCMLGISLSLQAQNTQEKVMKERVSFKNGPWTMAGELYLPEGCSAESK